MPPYKNAVTFLPPSDAFRNKFNKFAPARQQKKNKPDNLFNIKNAMILQHDIPNGYAHCFAGKDDCPHANTCLRAIAARLLTESREPQPPTVHTVNAAYVAQLPDRAACPLYRSNEPLRYAKGMTRLFDELPVKQAAAIRLRVMGCFSCERYFYHSRKGDRLISPDEQRKIANVFRSAAPGVTPKFDSYEYVIPW